MGYYKMEPPIPTQQPPAGHVDPLTQNIGYIPQQGYNVDPMMSKHLDFSESLQQLKNMLYGREYNEETDEWETVKVLVGYDSEGKEVMQVEGPLMEPRSIRAIIGWLQTFLNSNLFLSQLDEERINDIMWDVNTKLFTVFYNLRYKLTPKERGPLWASIEYPILFGLCRANRKITLDAISKTQQTHEIIQGGTPRAPTPDKEFKVLGW